MDIIVFILALPGLWIFLQTLSSLCYAGEVFIDGWLLRRLAKSDAAVIESDEDEPAAIGILVTISAFFGIVIAIFFGLVTFATSAGFATLNIGTELALQATLVGIGEVVWLIPYLKANNHAGEVKAAPLFQVVPVISLLLGLAAYVLHAKLGVQSAEKFAEIPSMLHIVAAGIIIIGGIIIALTKVKGKWNVDRKTIGLMLLASFIIAIIAFFFKDAALESNFIATAFYSGIGMTLSGIFIFLFITPYRKQFLAFCEEADKPAVLTQLANEVIDSIAIMSSNLAVVIGPSVMAVLALNAWQPVFILIIGWVLAKRGSEAHAELLNGAKLRQTIFTIALLAIGTVLIAL
jgi:hypothetical protein